MYEPVQYTGLDDDSSDYRPDQLPEIDQYSDKEYVKNQQNSAENIYMNNKNMQSVGDILQTQSNLGQSQIKYENHKSHRTNSRLIMLFSGFFGIVVALIIIYMTQK